MIGVCLISGLGKQYSVKSNQALSASARFLSSAPVTKHFLAENIIFIFFGKENKPAPKTIIDGLENGFLKLVVDVLFYFIKKIFL